MSADEQLFDLYVFGDLQVHKYFEFEFVLQIFVLDEDGVVLVVDFDVPGEEDEFAVVVGVEVKVEVVLVLYGVLCVFSEFEMEEVVVQFFPVFFVVEQPEFQFLFEEGGVGLFNFDDGGFVVEEEVVDALSAVFDFFEFYGAYVVLQIFGFVYEFF